MFGVVHESTISVVLEVVASTNELMNSALLEVAFTDNEWRECNNESGEINSRKKIKKYK